MGINDNAQLLSKRVTNWFRGIAVIMIVLSHYAEWWAWFVPSEGGAELLRTAFVKLGSYGVGMFLLFSGYAMVKSLGQERMYPEFIKKRFKNVYVPYLIVIGIIELISGGFTSSHDFLDYATGYDYWYMFILFVFYIGFIAIWTIMGGREVRVITLAIFTYIFSYTLYKKGMQDFWYISNIAFVLGVIAGEYEAGVKKLMDKAGTFMICLLTAGMLWVIYSGLFGNGAGGMEPDRWRIWKEIGASLTWAVWVLAAASKWRFCDRAITILGTSSLYIYLTHTYIFMRCVNNFDFSFAVRFLISSVLTVLVAILCKKLIEGLMKPLSAKRKIDNI